MTAHHYRSNGEPMSHVDQLSDSINLEGVPVVTELFFPLGLRYHALHHLFPSLPYHNLGKAHRRLMAELPVESGYRETVYPGYWAVIVDVVRNARRVSRLKRCKGMSVADEWYERREQLLTERYGSARGAFEEPMMPDEPLRAELQPSTAMHARTMQTAS
jgi:hypothetical protein